VIASQKVQPKKELAYSIRRNAQENEIRYFECKEIEYQCKDCPNRRLERKRIAHCYARQLFRQ